MGIRISKRLGWALLDLQRDGSHLADPRLNLDAPSLQWETPTIEDYLAHLDTRDDNLGSLDRGHLRRDTCTHRHLLDDTLWHGAESNDPNILILTPLSCHDWVRRDDPIDSIDWHLTHDGDLSPEVHVLRGGIYPFIGSFMDTRTGARLPDAVLPYLRAANSGTATASDLSALAEDFGMTPDEAAQHIAPTIPVDIAALATVMDLFTSPDVIRDLRPVLATFWR